MRAKKKQNHSRKTNGNVNKPITEGRLTYLFNDMKDFVRSTVKGSETVLRKEFKDDIQTVQQAITEHSSMIKDLKADVKHLDDKIDGVENRLDAKIDGVRAELKEDIQKLDTKIDGVEHRLSEKIDKIGEKTENHKLRITNLERGQAAPT